MKRIILKHHKNRTIALFVARVISTIAIAFFLLMVTGDLESINEPFTIEGLLVGGFAIMLLLAIIFCWFKEGIGGIILIIISVLFAIFIYISAGNYKLLASVLISLPFLLSGILFFTVGRVEK